MARDGDVYIGQVIQTKGAIEFRADIAIVKSGDVPGDWLSISTLQRVEPIKFKSMRNLKSKRALSSEDWNTVTDWIKKNEKRDV